MKWIYPLLFYYFILAVTSCKDDCKEETLPYFDYRSLHVFRIKDNILDRNDTLKIVTTPSNYNYLSIKTRGQWWNGVSFVSTAYACYSPTRNENHGKSGAKYGITAINIYPDSVFLEGKPTTENLKQLFTIESSDDFSTKSSTPIFYHKYSTITLSTTARPVAIYREYTFTVEFIKENGSIVRGKTPPMIWTDL